MRPIHPTQQGHISAPIASYLTDRAVFTYDAAWVVCFYQLCPALLYSACPSLNLYLWGRLSILLPAVRNRLLMLLLNPLVHGWMLLCVYCMCVWVCVYVWGDGFSFKQSRLQIIKQLFLLNKELLEHYVCFIWPPSFNFTFLGVGGQFFSLSTNSKDGDGLCVRMVLKTKTISLVLL